MAAFARARRTWERVRPACRFTFRITRSGDPSGKKRLERFLTTHMRWPVRVAAMDGGHKKWAHLRQAIPNGS